ncbi:MULTISPECIES: metal ABC transporter solute-binding protein, Zn/Mn family [Aerococcus]|uniref:Zinc ABC transporter substrate-binding protein n=3 Tax=Aerococcus TaxID=1375 RepID=A0A5N1GND9_9LACT|nr:MULTISPECIES: zinc ABC transporter substrate-binding protein [Aerococcus]KAA9302312.1 zinc ABC transporter substrate-binding protein [Aerococcus sanguinicola]MDK6369066.1 zinc ABC transporter substrate-binding protein [Aerococcus sp. UMB9870]MDK6678968.1 zinc ABC transporter substrate-binding protein [Aerococcus sp. UMB8608]MDK6686559.1 zinc ABC transporter substrate-binding protein [Aerococcus sp. UMB8623]MDK6939627.1 zinc ABC transporter substrate-binding protein [Aerococcus sp. UMB8487]
MKKKYLYLFALGLALLVTACQSSQKEAESGDKLQVMTSFYPIQALTQAVAGDHADVQVMIANGQEVHDYEPSAKNLADLEASDLFIYNSDEMETWVPTMVESLKQDQVAVHEAAGGLDLMAGQVTTIDGAQHEGHDHAHDGEGDDGHDHPEGDLHVHAKDPHTWLDPVLAQKEVQGIADALAGQDPDHQADYQANAEAFIKELAQLDQDFKTALADKKDRHFVVDHAAFNYLAARYDLEQIALTSVDSTASLSPAKLAQLEDYIRQRGIEVIFFQQGGSSKLADVIAHDTGIKTSSLSSMESPDASIEANGEGYLHLMRQNLDHLEAGLK